MSVHNMESGMAKSYATQVQYWLAVVWEAIKSVFGICAQKGYIAGMFVALRIE